MRARRRGRPEGRMRAPPARSRTTFPALALRLALPQAFQHRYVTAGSGPSGGHNGLPMGKVVELETPRKESQGARSKRTRRRRSKTALVLGGGGFTGGVYEIGALRALDLLAVNR